MDASKKQLIKELREYLDKVEKDETTYCELLMEIPELLKGFNCDEIMRVGVNSETIRNLFFQILITKWKMPEFFARDLAYEVEKIIKEYEDD